MHAGAINSSASESPVLLATAGPCGHLAAATCQLVQVNVGVQGGVQLLGKIWKLVSQQATSLPLDNAAYSSTLWTVGAICS